MEVSLGPGHIVLDGRRIKMPLSTKVGLGASNIVLDGNPAPPKTGHITPIFWDMAIVAKGLDGSRYHMIRR